MAIDTSYYFNPEAAKKMGTTPATSSDVKGKHELDMNDFMMLMVEQMKQQDMNSTTDTAQYINQLSQYTMIEALTSIQTDLSNGLQSIKELAMSSYSMSMIGKEATIAIEKPEGEMETIRGNIEGVTYFNGDPMVIVNGEQYKLSQVMSVADKNSSSSDIIAEAATNAARAASEAARAAIEMAQTITEGAQDDQGQVENQTEQIIEDPEPQTQPEATDNAAEQLAGQQAAAQRIAEENS